MPKQFNGIYSRMEQMKTKIIIRTPKGQASKTEKKIKPFIVGLRKVKIETYVNEFDNELVWDVDGSIKDVMKINRNVLVFETLIRGMMNNKMLKKTIGKNLSEEDQEELKNMLFNQTSCEVVKEATAQELVEANKTWWERTKERFKKSPS